MSRLRALVPWLTVTAALALILATAWWLDTTH